MGHRPCRIGRRVRAQSGPAGIVGARHCARRRAGFRRRAHQRGGHRRIHERDEDPFRSCRPRGARTARGFRRNAVRTTRARSRGRGREPRRGNRCARCGTRRGAAHLWRRWLSRGGGDAGFRGRGRRSARRVAARRGVRQPGGRRMAGNTAWRHAGGADRRAAIRRLQSPDSRAPIRANVTR